MTYSGGSADQLKKLQGDGEFATLLVSIYFILVCTPHRTFNIVTKIGPKRQLVKKYCSHDLTLRADFCLND